jgi:hypothetical protein
VVQVDLIWPGSLLAIRVELREHRTRSQGDWFRRRKDERFPRERSPGIVRGV